MLSSLMQCMASVLKDYKNDLESILAVDKQVCVCVCVSIGLTEHTDRVCVCVCVCLCPGVSVHACLLIVS